MNNNTGSRGRNAKRNMVKKSILKILKDVNPGEPHTVARLRKEMKEVLGVDVSWKTTEKYAEELMDEGRVRRVKWDTNSGDRVAYRL